MSVKKEKHAAGSEKLESLLSEGVENCPGCKCVRKQGDGPPIKQLVLMGLVMLCNALPISILFPYLYFMVREFHITERNEDIGYYAGWIGSSFMIGRCLTGVLWGLIADRYGRKPAMFAGIISVLVFNTLFGFSTSFWMVIASRFCLGSFNGMLGTVQAYATEICTVEYQSLGMAVVSTMWGFALVIGPAIGGYLSQPAEKYPNLFTEDSLFARFPFLLPPLCVSAFAAVVLVTSFFLPETLHKHPTQINDSIEDPKPNETTRNQSIFKNWPLIASIVLFCFLCLQDIAFIEIFSLWSVSPKSAGGLGFNSSDVGRVLTVSGFGMLIFQLCFFSPLTKKFGPILVTRVASILTIPFLFVFPTMWRLNGGILWVVVLTVSTSKYILNEAATTGAAILINNSVKQAQRGTANGLSLSMQSLFKAIGPAAGGSIFAWSQKRLNASILPGDYFVFFFLAIWLFLVALGTLQPFLPRSTQQRASEENEEN